MQCPDLHIRGVGGREVDRRETGGVKKREEERESWGASMWNKWSNQDGNNDELKEGKVESRRIGC